MEPTGQAAFRRRLRQAGRRIVADFVLEDSARAAAAAGLVAAVAVACQRAFAVRAPVVAAAVVLGAAAFLYVLVRWWLWRPSPMKVALAVDERLGLRERFSTTLAVSASADPFAAAVREETYARLGKIPLARHFPIRLSRHWASAAGGWAVMAILVLWMPPLDLLGREADAKKAATEEKRLDEAKAVVGQTTSKVEAMVKQLGLTEAAGELAKLNELAPGAPPAEVRRQAIRRLGELADKLHQSGVGEKAEAGQALQQMMKQLKMPSQGLSKDLARALARSNFGEAAAMLRKLEERLAQRDLKPEERAALAKELADLARQLQALADRQKELEDALEKAGLDRKLAGLDEDALRRALEKAGLDAQAIQKLVDKVRACRTASAQCRALGRAFAACTSGTPGADALSDEGMLALGDRLDGLEALRQQMALVGATFDEIEFGMGLLGQGMGLGMIGPFGLGESDSVSAGAGGPGHGSAPVETGPDEPTKSVGTRVKTPAVRPGPVIGTWYEQVEQTKGESVRQGQDTFQAAKDRAAEAISENRIPSRYHGAVKQYFGDLDKDKPAAGN